MLIRLHPWVAVTEVKRVEEFSRLEFCYVEASQSGLKPPELLIVAAQV